MKSDDSKARAIKAAPNDRNCDNCTHRVGLDNISYCECWECNFEPKVKKDE